MINIVCCTDHKYIMPTGVMIYSVCKNHQENTVIFHLICNDDITPNDKEKIKKIIVKFKNHVIFYNIDFNIPKCFTIGENNQSNHITISTYYRIFLTDILPKELDKVIYLDVDLVIKHSLYDIYNINIDDYGIAATYDSSFQNSDNYKRLKLLENDSYFNAGVLLINLNFWRENNIKQKCIDVATKMKGKLKYHDQDILNYIFYQKKIILPFTYNLSSGFLYNDYTLSNKFQEELNYAINNPYIIHYTGASKPWHSSCIHPYRQDFIYYFKQTEWYNPIKFTLSYIKRKILNFYRQTISNNNLENPYINIKK